MIRYNLACEAGHAFESWFPSSDAFDEQVARGLVTCPICDTARVAKAPMAPAVAKSGRGADAGQGAVVPTTAATVPVMAEPERRMRAMLRAMREHIAAHSEHVGERFPEEARRMHYGEAEHRSIHGRASLDEARALIEEGIDVAPLPILPDDRN